MSSDDRRPSEDPEMRRLQRLARRGRQELQQLDDAHADSLWDGVRAAAFDPPDEQVGTPAHGGVPEQPGSSVRWLPLAVAAAIALVVGVGIGATLTDGTDQSAPATLATIELDPLAEDVTPRTAVLRQGEAGRTIELQLAGLPRTDGFHEVWLLDPETGALVSLGPVRADAVYAVPDTVDLADLSVLDVSAEPQDGDPTHSGDSLLRGEVRWTG
jgi:anti-sigma-K factor RskA